MLQDEWWPQTGGGPVHTKELALALAEHQGCTVDIYTRALKKDGESYKKTERFLNGKVTLHRLNPCTDYWNPVGRLSSAISPLPRIINEGYDIIHGHTYIPAVPTRISGAITTGSTVFTVHGTTLTTGARRDQTILSNGKRFLEKVFVLWFDYDAVVSVNHAHVDLLKRNHDHIRPIPNGVNIDRFSSDIDQTQDILFIGRLVPVKRVSDLITAFAQIAGSFPESNLRIVGTGPQKEALMDQVENLELSDRILFEGSVPRDDITEKYAAARVFVLPSLREGHPLTLLEAWASETPVVATSVEGIEEFVDHRQTGYLVPPKSADELADALRFVLENPQTAREWSNNARKFVEEEYSWEGIAERTYELYQDIV